MEGAAEGLVGPYGRGAVGIGIALLPYLHLGLRRRFGAISVGSDQEYGRRDPADVLSHVA